ncbi:MAG TPA: GNAT family N-acetyltransferase [Aggregatilineaceae bacterium]|nr:GNAT family N-acetyltransferase [Aggregatilineaceae bacterium]
MELKTFEGIHTVDPDIWNRVTRGYPFAGWVWCQYGEQVQGRSGHYLIIFEGDQPVGGAIFWVINDEPIPSTNRIVQGLLARYLHARPLVVCRTALHTNHTGLFLPANPVQRERALTEIRHTAIDLVRQQHGSFFLADFLSPAEIDCPWDNFYRMEDFLKDGTYLDVEWDTFDDYLASLKNISKKTFKNIRNNTRLAQTSGITISAQHEISSPDQILRLIAIQRKYYQMAFNPTEISRTIEALSRLPEINYRWMMAHCDGRLVACELLLFDEVNRAATVALYASDQETKYAYFLLSYEDIRCCIEDFRAKIIFYGSHCYEFKHRMGFENDLRNNLVFYPAARLEQIITRPLLHFMNG